MGLTPPMHDIPLVWDEVNDDDFDRYEIYRSPYLPIINLHQVNKQFMITGMYASWYTPGDIVLVTGSTGNDGTYTVDTSTEVGGITTIKVLEAIPSAVIDGYIGNSLISQLAAEVKKGYYKDREMPVGFYYYVVYAIDNQENYSDPTNIIQKFSPTDVTAPPTPTGIVASRTSKYNAVELSWNDVEQYDIKGYIVERTLNPYAGTPTWTTLAITGSNKFTDSEIPRGYDATYRSTFVRYRMYSYDTSGNVSSATADTGIFEIPLILGVSVSLDYLNLNVYWDEVLPEISQEAVACLLRVKGSSTWTFMGVSEWPKNFFRIGVDLLPNTDYELALAVIKNGTHDILEAVGVSDWIYINGDQTAVFPPADIIAIYNSSNQDGQYTIATSAYSAPLTKIGTSTNLPVEYTVNGGNQARNYVQISGDHLSDFTDKLVYIAIFGSTGNDGRYRVLSSDLYKGQTRLFLLDTLPSGTWDGEVTSGTIVNLTDLLDTIQAPTQLVPIPDYATDTTTPTAPVLLTAVDDPENRRAYLNWTRIADEDDFLTFHVEINILGGDYPITVVDQANDHFTVAGDQTAYFVIGQRIYVYGSTGNDGWYDVTNIILNAGATEVYVEGDIPNAVADGKLMTDYAWALVDKTKYTSLQAYFPYVTGTTYWFRVRAIDRTGNQSLPDSCITSLPWINPFATPANLDLPQWIDYSEYYSTTYKDTNSRRYGLTVNDGGRLSKWFEKYVLYYALGAQGTATYGSGLFAPDDSEILALLDRNTFNWDTKQVAYAITAVDIVAETITVAGDVTAIFPGGKVFTIYGSTGNDGDWTVNSSAYGAGVTVITVTGNITDATVDGYIGLSLFIWATVKDVQEYIWFGPAAGILRIDPTA